MDVSFCKKSFKPNGTYRQVVCTDTTAWLKELPTHSTSSFLVSSSSDDENVGQLFPEDCLWHVFTSMPDISEISALFVNYSNQIEKAVAYEKWIVNTAFDIFTNLPENCYAVFLQSPVRMISTDNTNEVVRYIDKSKLIHTAADRAGCTLMWHKMTLNTNIEKKSIHRPSYSDLICFCKGSCRYNAANFATPDIIERGQMIWPKGILM